MQKPIKLNSKVLEIKQLTPLVRQFKLSVPKEFTFISGQYITVLIKKENEIVKRLYSIASPPNNEGYIELCLNKVEGGIGSGFFFSLKEGDIINSIGPMGLFIIKDKNKDVVFISTGTGIAPYRSMINDLLNNGYKNKITLITGFRYEEDVLYDKEWNNLKEEHKNFEYHYTLSRPRDPNYNGNKGYIQLLIEKHIKDFKRDFYLCGLNDMIKETQGLLEKKGANKENIYFERYD